jgi:hypothetical protein
LARTESGRIHRDALRFVFTIEQNGQIPPRHPLTQLRLQVPTATGTMVRAGSAAFGPGWDGRDGSDLAAVIEDAGDLDRTLAELGHRLVDPTPGIVRPGDSLSAWSALLAKIGVTNGLPAHVTTAATPKLWGWQLRGPELAKRTRVPDPIAQQWAAYLATRPPLNIAHPQTEYVVNRKPVWAVGQTIVEQLTDPARDAYARLILHGLSHWPTDYLTIDWDRDRYGNKDRQTFPTPLGGLRSPDLSSCGISRCPPTTPNPPLPLSSTGPPACSSTLTRRCSPPSKSPGSACGPTPPMRLAWSATSGRPPQPALSATTSATSSCAPTFAPGRTSRAASTPT